MTFFNNRFYIYGFEMSSFDTSGFVYWHKHIGKPDTNTTPPVTQYMNRIYPVTENGQDYLLWCGNTNYFTPGGMGITNLGYVIKTNLLGDTVWTHLYDVASDVSFCLAPDSNYIFSLLTGKGTIIKVDRNTGDTLWSKQNKFQLFGQDAITNEGIISTGNAFYVTGNIYPVSWINFLLMKTDTLGVVQWAKAYGDSTANACLRFAKCHDGGFLLVGNSAPVAASYADFLVVRTDANGDTLWCRRYDHNHGVDGAETAVETDDHGFLILGGTYPVGGNFTTQRELLIKIDSAGNIQWAKIYFKTARNEYINQQSNGNIIFVSAYIHITDSLGGDCLAQPATVTMGYPQMHITNITTMPDQGMNISFSPNSQVKYYPNYPYIITNYCDFTNVPEIKEPENELSVYPNPAHNAITVRSNESGVRSVEIENVVGEKVFSLRTPNSKLQTKIDVSNLAPGIYFVKVATDRGGVVRKFIKQ
jgi:hypothetical protein